MAAAEAAEVVAQQPDSQFPFNRPKWVIANITAVLATIDLQNQAMDEANSDWHHVQLTICLWVGLFVV